MSLYIRNISSPGAVRICPSHQGNCQGNFVGSFIKRENVKVNMEKRKTSEGILSTFLLFLLLGRER